MAENEGGTGTEVQAAQTEPSTSGGVKFAGKYESPEALEQGYREIHKSIHGKELPATEKLFGKDGRFTDVSKLESAYNEAREVQRRIGQAAPKNDPKSEPKQPDNKLTITKKAAEPSGDEVADALSEAGLDATELGTEWVKSGKLTDDQYAKLAAVKGPNGKPLYPRALVDSYLRGQVAEAQGQVAQQQQAVESAKSDAVKIAGGEEQYNALLAFAASQPDLESWNARFDTDPKAYPQFFEVLAARYAAKNGTMGSRTTINGGTVNNQPVNTIRNMSDFKSVREGVLRGDTDALMRLKNVSIEDLAKFGQ